jgi:hypothetical protein
MTPPKRPAAAPPRGGDASGPAKPVPRRVLAEPSSLGTPRWSLILRRLLAALPNLVGVVVITFVLTRALPGDPAAYFAGGAATQEAVDQVRRSWAWTSPCPSSSCTMSAPGCAVTSASR